LGYWLLAAAALGLAAAAAEATPPAVGASANDVGPGPAPAPANARDKATLTVHVKGDGKPVAQAEVKFKLPKDAEEKRFTDTQGGATLITAAGGKVGVQVIAKGWDSRREEIVLKVGQAQELTIVLQREGGAAPPPAPKP
jgi:hypothetical protein